MRVRKMVVLASGLFVTLVMNRWVVAQPPATPIAPAQAPAADASPATQTPPAAQTPSRAARGPGGIARDGGGSNALASPTIESDKKVTFKVKAPDAKSVTLTCDFQDEKPLVKGEDGTWSLTVGPIDPEVYYYNFVVDGVRTIDPGNPKAKVGYYTSTLTSILEVPGNEPAFYDVKDVPHGELRTIVYKSKSNNVTRELTVYIPPGYDDAANKDKRYPVLYLLHGNANDQQSWHRYGRANEILDNLLAEDKIKPFMVVMPLGYGRASINGDGTGIPGRGPAAGGPGAPGTAGRGPGDGPDLYEQDVMQDIIPMIDAKYRTIADRKARAIAGFSMGGGQSGRIGLRNLDTFSHVVIMSAGAGGANAEPIATLAKDVEGTNKKLDLLWIGCGRDDGLFGSAKGTSDALKLVGINHIFRETDGAHHWRVWRRYLNEIAPQLFKNAGA
jgi:enterochelin esterase-like enzyme